MAERSPEKGERAGQLEGDYFGRQDSTSRRTPRKNQSRVAAVQSPTSPTSPRTPRTPLLGRSISSSFNSPGLGFRTDDEYFVFELGSRILRAGLGGESAPRCQLDFGPEASKRAGDYSRWLPGITDSTRDVSDDFEGWGRDHELWRDDLRDVDLGLVSAKLDRALRFAITEHILVLDDSKKRKYMLAVPPLVPHPLLSTILTAFFSLFPSPPAVTLLSSPLLCTVAAGLRSALVIDIGWAESTVSVVYECREPAHKRTSRAMKQISWEVKLMLIEQLKIAASSDGPSLAPSFEETEEVLTRMVWCRKKNSGEEHSRSSTDEKLITIPLTSTRPPATVCIPFSEFSNPIEAALFDYSTDPASHDDHELPLHFLIYKMLQTLPIDVRQSCISRILFTGRGSEIPGLKSRLLSEVEQLVSVRGWDPVDNYGSASNPPLRRTILRPAGAVAANKNTTQEPKYANKDTNPESETPAHLQPPLPDPVLANIQARAGSTTREPQNLSSTQAADLGTASETLGSANTETFILRCVNSLGAWAGASLVAGLRVRGLVEIDGEKFMQHGLTGAARGADSKRQSVQQSQRQSLVTANNATLAKMSDAESGAWTLGAWA